MTAGSDPFTVDEDKALAALLLAWGNSYDIYINGGQWQAWHKDAGDTDMIDGTTTDELNRHIRDDFARRVASGGEG
jgi:hypothetical protein